MLGVGSAEVVGVIALFLTWTPGHREKGLLATEQAPSMDHWVIASTREVNHQNPVGLLC